jgi:hypothetical protein
MAHKLFGDKLNFAIELEVESPLDRFGIILIWFKGLAIGTRDDVAMLGVPLYSLKFIENSIDSSFETMNKTDVYSFIKSENNLEGGKFYKHFGDTFDDFSIVAYTSDDTVVFIWKLHESPFFSYNNYPAGILSAIVPLQDYLNVIYECENYLGLNQNKKH